VPESIGDEKFKYVVRVLITLIKYEEKSVNPTISELVSVANLNKPLFHSHLKRNLERSGLVEFKVNPDRTITAYLTKKGRRLAQALKSVEDILREIGVV